jgi:hypothetical protein
MSWEIINRILGLASVDKEFAQELLKDPEAAIEAHGFQLTPEEKRIFNETSAKNLHDLSQQLMQKLHHDYFNPS